MELDSAVYRENSFTSPDYCFYKDRLSTFTCWPVQISPIKFDLAENGLYYTGESDVVKCFSCGVRLYNWMATDDARTEHLKYSPTCFFLKMIGPRSIFNTSSVSHQPYNSFGIKSDRTSSFLPSSSISNSTKYQHQSNTSAYL